MKTAAIVSAAVLAAGGGLPQAASAQPVGGPSVDVRDAAARMVVIPEARGDVDVRIAGGDPSPAAAAGAPRGRAHRGRGRARAAHHGLFGDRLRLERRSQALEPVGQRARPGPDRTLRDLPVITVRTPLRAGVGASGAVWGEVGPSETLHLAHSGCGDWTVAPVRGGFDVASQGVGRHARRARPER